MGNPAESGAKADAAQSSGTQPSPIGLGRVRDLLIAKPELIRNDEGLMRALGLRPIASNVVDFGPAALARLEAAWTRESSARQEIEQVARANFAAQALTHEVIIDLLQSRNNADLARRVEHAAVDRFGLVAGVVAIEGETSVPAGWRALRPGLVEDLLGREGIERIGPAAATEELFGERADEVGSMALVRISAWDPQRFGVLAFAASDPDAFRRDMGAELVAFLARVVERTAERWPPISA